MQAEIGLGKIKLLAGTSEEDGIPGCGRSRRRRRSCWRDCWWGEDVDDDTFPPAVVVEGVDFVADLEGAAGLPGRDGADEDKVDVLLKGAGPGFVVGHQSVEL